MMNFTQFGIKINISIPITLTIPLTVLRLCEETGDEEKEEALNFLYEMKNNLAKGEYEHFAEKIRYPITVNVAGEPRNLRFCSGIRTLL